MGKSPRKHSNAFKAQVGLAALTEEETIGKLASKYGVHPTQIRRWRDEVKAGLPEIFNKGKDQESVDKDALIERLYSQVGELTMDLSWLKKNSSLSLEEKIRLIEIVSSQSIRKQVALLQLNRSSYYYQINHPKLVKTGDLELMNWIDRIHTESPSYGSRMITAQLRRGEKLIINRKRVQRLMREMEIEAIYPKPNLSLPDKAHPIYPYQLKGVQATSVNHIWSVDITYIPLMGSFLY